MVYKYVLSPKAIVQFGYSKMFATSSMEALKGGDNSELQNWAWVMITLRLTLFKAALAELKNR